jgi:hypothetical protein
MQRSIKVTPGEREKRTDLDNELLEIKKRLRVLEDIEQIKQLQYRYLNCVMFAKYDEIGDCFAENAKIHFIESRPVTTGKAAIEKFFKDEIAKIHVGKEGDFEVHPIISVDGDKATGNWVMYIMYFYPRTGQSLFWVQGIYDAEYVREKGKWKFGYLKWRERLGLPGGGPPIEPIIG